MVETTEPGPDWQRDSADVLWTRTFSEHGTDDPLRDFFATYFARDDDPTRAQVMDFLDRIVARYALRSTSRDSEVREAIEGLLDDLADAFQDDGPTDNEYVRTVIETKRAAILDRSSEAAPTGCSGCGMTLAACNAVVPWRICCPECSHSGHRTPGEAS